VLEENKTEIESEVKRLVDKFTEENNLNKIGILFEKPKKKNGEWKELRGYYDRKEHKIYISIERDTKALIFLTLAHELAHVLSPSDILHKYWFWDIMDKITLPFVKKNLSLEEDRTNLEKLENPTTNEDGNWVEVYLEPREGKIYFFVEKEEIDQVWKLIREETLRGKLGTEACATTTKGKEDSKKHQISIYSKDIQDKKDIARILERLLELGFSDFTVKEGY
jgi:hypothetical protein